MPVLSVGYIILDSPNMSAWESFGADILGMMPVSTIPGELRFRIDDFQSRLIIRESAEPRLAGIGLQVTNRRDLTTMTELIRDSGVQVDPGSDADAAYRCVSGLVKLSDPGGTPLELFHGPHLQHEPPITPHVSGFITGDLGFGHAVVTTPDLTRTATFYEDLLGFEERNTMPRPGGDLLFMSPNPRHHAIALAQRSGEPDLLHFMVEAATLDDVGRALDRVNDAGVQLVSTLGRHTNDHMVSFYVRAPDGFAIEFGWGGLMVSERSGSYAITKASFWGHRSAPRLPEGQ